MVRADEELDRCDRTSAVLPDSKKVAKTLRDLSISKLTYELWSCELNKRMPVPFAIPNELSKGLEQQFCAGVNPGSPQVIVKTDLSQDAPISATWASTSCDTRSAHTWQCVALQRGRFRNLQDTRNSARLSGICI